MNRRSILTGIVTAFSTVAALGVAYPFLRAWFPMGQHELTLDLQLDGMAIGESRLVRWLGRNVYVVRRKPDIEARLNKTTATREDPLSKLSSQPLYAQNTYRSRRPEHLLVYANCTHLGCEVGLKDLLDDKTRDISGADKDSVYFAGFRCPCHSSEFDAAGRVEKGSAARFNLEVPNYDYVGRNVIRLKKV